MKINVLVFANKQTGWGHWYRSIAFAEYAQKAGHQVTIISDRQPPRHLAGHIVPYDDQALWRSPLYKLPDWLVIDLPEEGPGWLYDHCHATGVKTCILNGVGHQVGDRADLRIVQGLGDGKYSGVDYIILREEVFHIKEIRRPIIEWFVFGGAADKMGLTRQFPNEQRISFSISDKEWQADDRHDDGFLVAASQCRRACVAMGMTVLELVAMQIPTYVFSISETHLRFAQALDEAGYIKAWPNVGLPMRLSRQAAITSLKYGISHHYYFDKITHFLSKPFTPSGKPIDGQAPKRILKLMAKGE